MSKSSEVQAQNVLMAAADELFGNVGTTLNLRGGRQVTVKIAMFKQLRVITEFVTAFISQFEESQLVSLIETVSGRQEAAILRGESMAQVDTQQIVREVAGHASVLSQVLAHSLDAIPPLVAEFSDLSPDDVGEMHPDEVLIVIYTIFGANYSFFTRQALPAVLAAFGRLQATSQKANAKKPKK